MRALRVITAIVLFLLASPAPAQRQGVTNAQLVGVPRTFTAPQLFTEIGMPVCDADPPTGSCTDIYTCVDDTNDQLWTCVSTAWVSIGGGGGATTAIQACAADPPVGACTNLDVCVDDTNNNLYACVATVWQRLATQATDLACTDCVALTAETSGSYAAGDAEAGNATGVACTDCVALGSETSGNYAAGDAEAGDATVNSIVPRTGNDVTLAPLAAGELILSPSDRTPVIAWGDSSAGIHTLDFIGHSTAATHTVQYRFTNTGSGGTNTFSQLVSDTNVNLSTVTAKLAFTAGTGVTFANLAGVITFDNLTAGEIGFNTIAGNGTNIAMDGENDADVFHLDASTDRIGIGTAAPATLLDVDGTITTTGLTCTDCVALTSETSGSYVSAATASQGLTMNGTEGATLGLIDCAANEVVKRNGGDTAWECAADDTASCDLQFVIFNPEEVAASVRYVSLWDGGSTAGCANNADDLKAPIALTMDDLRVEVNTDPGGSESWTVAISNDCSTGSSLTCTISSGGTSCTNSTAVNISQHDPIVIRVTQSTPAPAPSSLMRVAFCTAPQ